MAIEEERPRRAAPRTYSCPKCFSSMRLASVTPEPPDHEHRMFECPACKHVETVRVKYR